MLAKKGTHFYREFWLDIISVLIYYAIPVRRELTFVKISSLKHIPSLLHLWIVICKRHCKTPTTLCSGPLPQRASITVILNLSILRSTFETTTLFKVSAGCNYSKNLKLNFEKYTCKNYSTLIEWEHVNLSQIVLKVEIKLVVSLRWVTGPSEE